MSYSYHIKGHHPVREADTEERLERMRVVNIPLGFESLQIAVYGEGLSPEDCIEAAFEYLKKTTPEWTKDWQHHKASAFVTKPKVEETAS